MRNTVLSAVFLVLGSTAALAAPKRDRSWTDCISDVASTSIRGCTEVLARGGREAEQTRGNAHYNRGIEYAGMGRNDEALADFKAAAALRPDWGRPNVQMALLYRKLKKPDLAFAEINNAIARDPNVEDGYYFRADMLDDRGEYEEALSDVNRAIQLNPADPMAYNLRGVIENRMRKFTRAIRNFNVGLQLEPRKGVIYSNRAWSFAQMGELELSLSDYDYAIQLAADQPHVLNGRGIVHSRMGNVDLALADFNRALRVDPKFRQARENRVDMLLRKKDCKTALPELDALIAEESKAVLLAFRGTCQGAIGNAAAALLDFNAALSQEPRMALAVSGQHKAEEMLTGKPQATF